MRLKGPPEVLLSGQSPFEHALIDAKPHEMPLEGSGYCQPVPHLLLALFPLPLLAEQPAAALKSTNLSGLTKFTIINIQFRLFVSQPDPI